MALKELTLDQLLETMPKSPSVVDALRNYSLAQQRAGLNRLLADVEAASDSRDPDDAVLHDERFDGCA